MRGRHHHRLCATIILTAVISSGSLALEVSTLIKPAIPVMPLLYDGTVCIQDFVSGTYRLRLVSVAAGTSQELRDNQTAYLFPLAFGGTHAAWIGTTSGQYGGGGSGSGGGDGNNYYVQAINASTKALSYAVQEVYYIEQIAATANRVVWTDYRFFTITDTIVEVYLHDFSTASILRVTDQHSYKASPSIRGNSIAWQDYRNKGADPRNSDIYFYDIAAQQEKPVCTNSAYQDQPDVHGNLVVWQDYRSAVTDTSNADIYMRDLSTGSERAICTAPGYQGSPRVYGSTVVWQDYRHATGGDTANADIYSYDLTTGQETPVTTKAGYQGEPYLYGNTVVWFDYMDNTIYKATIPASSVASRRTVARAASLTAASSRKVSGGAAPSCGECVDMRGRRLSAGGLAPAIAVFEAE